MWVSLVEALDHTAAAMVAGLEHRLCAADAVTAAKLHHQLEQARRLEAVTAAAAASARHTSPAHDPAPVAAAGPDHH